jgi:hypothetical protein
MDVKLQMLGTGMEDRIVRYHDNTDIVTEKHMRMNGNMKLREERLDP